MEELKLPGCRVQQHRDAHTILDGCFFVSGTIPRLTEFELGLPGHVTLVSQGGGGGQGGETAGTEAAGSAAGGWGRSALPRGDWLKDPLVSDERYVAVRIKGGVDVLFNACFCSPIVLARKAIPQLPSQSCPIALIL